MDNQGPCQCPPADAARHRRRPPSDGKSADFSHFRQLARLMLLSSHQGFPAFRRGKMDKFETLAFAIAFIATGLLTFVASMPIA
jgi:hypothetical protein